MTLQLTELINVNYVILCFHLTDLLLSKKKKVIVICKVKRSSHPQK